MTSQQVQPGHYARKQLLGPSRVVAWTHRARFEHGLGLVARHGGQTLLDYGCGDATFLTLLHAQPRHPGSMVGCEIHEDLVADCRARLGGLGGIAFEHAAALGREHDGRYDTILCMEVLEHVVEVDVLLDDFHRLLAPSGRLIVSVPVETGPPVIVKQAARTIAGWRGIGDYPGVTPYTVRELVAALFAGPGPHIDRPTLRDGEGRPFHDHKGFNWMALRDRIARRFSLLETSGSPVTWLPPGLNSQVWFVAGRR
jgi:SAM-dependent methyltransferase